jgi:serine phosphatase RsbU (regulator of sigma subunit)
VSSQAPPRPRPRTALFDAYTRDLTGRDVSRLFTHETRDAYRYFSRGIDHATLDALPVWKRMPAVGQALFVAFAEKLSPARRLLYGLGLVFAIVGMLQAFTGFDLAWAPAGLIDVPLLVPTWRPGTAALLVAFALVNLLVLLEVADRLSLKNDLEIARDIQHAMLRHDTYRAPGVETFGQTRPANTVGGDFYEIAPQDDGRLVVALGDVAGKGSPAALLMALLLAIMRTLLDEGLDLATLMARLNLQIARHAPRSRFITLFFGVFDPATGQLSWVNAGHLPPLLRRADGRLERLSNGGMALGLTEGAHYQAADTAMAPGDTLLLYSDGITEAESPSGVAFDESGLEAVLAARPDATAPDLAGALLAAVTRHAQDHKFADDLSVVVLRCLPPLPVLTSPLSGSVQPV